MYRPSKPYKHKIIEAIRKTWRTPYASISFNTYPVIRKKFSFAEVDHTDGIGTKGVYHWQRGTLREAVIDALAMNLNDLAIVRATPYKMSNHITVPVEDKRVLKIVEAMAEECFKRNIAIAGGENSFHDTMEGIDISMTVSGFITRPKQNRCVIGDVLVGLKSSGVHANGMTKVRQLFGNKVLPAFTVPTAIYSDLVLKLVNTYDINGMMHITGGAFSKIKDILIDADARIIVPQKLTPQEIFYTIYKKGVSSEDMYSTFNCGVGFVLSMPERDAQIIVKKYRIAGIIGRITKGKGVVRIQSAFDATEVEF